jgi:hypothetical protein
MFELQESQVERGVFKLFLVKPLKYRFLNFIVSLGPIRGRLVGFSFFILGTLLNFWTLENLERVGSYFFIFRGIIWALFAISLVIYGAAFLLRTQSLLLKFDKIHQAFEYEFKSFWAKKPVAQGTWPFKDFKEIRVYGPTSSPQTPFGFIELSSKLPKDLLGSKFQFKVLSEDQIKIYPLNISKLIDKDPVGDWQEP